MGSVFRALELDDCSLASALIRFLLARYAAVSTAVSLRKISVNDEIAKIMNWRANTKNIF
ncbi:hypothetical protein D3C84_405240 [compost metagenome]